MKKLILVILTVAVLLGAAYYYFIWRNQPIAAPTTTTDPSNAFPGGTTKTPSLNSTSTSQQSSTENQVGVGSNFNTGGGLLSQISNRPVSGKTLIKQGLDNHVIFTDKATGQVYLSNLTQKTGAKKITSTTILRTNASFWTYSVAPNKIDAKATLQYQNTDGEILLFTGTIPTINSSSTEAATNTEMLGSDIIEPNPIIAITSIQDKDQIFYLTRTNPGDSLGYLYNLKTKVKTLVWQSPLNEWSPQWLSGSLISIQTKPSAEVAGSAYLLNTATKAVTPLLNNKRGLVALSSPSGNKVIYSESTSIGGSELKILDRQTNKEIFLPLSTMADKCVWNSKETLAYCGVPNNLPIGAYPDDWYSGSINFQDSIWQVDTITGQVKLVFNSLKSTTNSLMDVYQPQLSSDESTLTFINKQDLTLWSLELGK